MGGKSTLDRTVSNIVFRPHPGRLKQKVLDLFLHFTLHRLRLRIGGFAPQRLPGTFRLAIRKHQIEKYLQISSIFIRRQWSLTPTPPTDAPPTPPTPPEPPPPPPAPRP